MELHSINENSLGLNKSQKGQTEMKASGNVFKKSAVFHGIFIPIGWYEFWFSTYDLNPLVWHEWLLFGSIFDSILNLIMNPSTNLTYFYRLSVD